MSQVFDALPRNGEEGPEPALSALLEELANAKAKLRAAEANGVAATFGEPKLLESAIRTECLQVDRRSPLLPFDGSHGEAAEAYRVARTRITQHIRNPAMIVVSSAGPGDGKTVTAINLAGSLSLKAEADVLLVDADFRHSAVQKQLGLSAGVGLAEVLEGRGNLEQALIRAEQLPNLYILPAGKPVSNPSELLDSSRWKNLSLEIRREFQYIVVDSPPVAGVADYELIEAVSDGTLLVLRPDHTKRRMALEALRSIPSERLLGVVMNSTPEWFLSGVK
jgi:capsular exopolysaccharide synthesis family protein